MTADADDFAHLMEAVARRLLGDPNPRLSSKTELRFGNHGSLACDLPKGVFFNHETGDSGGVVALVMLQTGIPRAEVPAWLEREVGFRPNGNGAHAPRPKIVALYDYTDELGTQQFQVVRLQPKRFYQRRRALPTDPPDRVHDGWVNTIKGTRQVPYRLPEIQEAIASDRTVFIVEGEKDADNLWDLGIPATTNAMGAGKWPHDLNQYFNGADVVIVPDNDDAGRKHVAMVGAALSGGAERVRVLLLPGLAEKGDASDWLAAGGTADDWHRLVEKTARPFGEHLPAIPTTGTAKILTSRQFVEGFVPPDYAIDGIAQKSFIYSFTGQTGSGKTSILLLLAYLVATGRALGKHQIDRGKVLILAGENPTDARQRWIAMAAVLGFNLDEIDVYFIDGRFKIEELYDTVAAQVEALGGVALILVDTSAAFFEGEDENNNSQIGKHATMLRRLTTLKGGPCVLVACHPVKKAAGDNLLPRGGGAFLAEMDGNFTATERDGVVEFHWQGKLRGPDFDPIIFKLDAGVKCERLKDAKGRMILTVIARVLNADERAELERGKVRDEDAVLIAMLENPSASLRGIASKLGWFNNGEPDGTKVHRNATKLGAKDQGLTKQDRKQTWILTEKGKKEAEKLQFNRDAGKRERDD